MSETNSALVKDDISKKFLEKAYHYLESAEAFAAKEVPAFINELLNFKFVEVAIDFIFLTVLALFLLAISIYIFRCVYKELDKKDSGWGDDRVVFSTFGAAACLIVSVSIFGMGIKDNIVEMYKIKYAPRVYLLDYVKAKL